MNFDDIVKIVDQVKGLEDRLAVAEAERDNALRYTELLIAERDASNKLADECSNEAQCAQQSMLTAQAGKARAVEALKRIAEPPGCGCTPICQCRTLESRSVELEARMDIATEALEACQPALNWLAQQLAEAAVEALEKLATDLRQDPWGGTLHDVDSLRSILRARAAALQAGEAI